MLEPIGDVIQIDDVFDNMLFQFDNGKHKGTTTYVDEIDHAWKWRRGEFNIFSGYNNEGKSELFHFLALMKAMNDGWKAILYSPENYPSEDFYDNLLHTIGGKSTDKDNPYRMSKIEYIRAKERLKDLIKFVYIKPELATPANILKMFQDEIDKDDQIAICGIDPLIKVKRPDGIDRDDLYANYMCCVLTDFARVNAVSMNLIMHQLTPEKDKDGRYPKPDMYRIKGGGSWSDGCDNVLSVWRPDRALDSTSTRVIFSSQKIKKQKLVGIPQDVGIDYNRKSARYMSPGGQDLFRIIHPDSLR
jgi:twinkle protein